MTDEEREQIYEEEKAHADARSRLEQEKKAAAAAVTAKNTKGCGIGCLVLIVLIFILAMLSGPHNYRDKYGLDTRDPDYDKLRHFVDGKYFAQRTIGSGTRSKQ